MVAVMLVSALAQPTVAAAQSAAPEPGVAINHNAGSAAADKVERQTEAFFKCIVSKDIVTARTVVLSNDSAERARAVKKLSMEASECLGQQDGLRLTTKYSLYSGGIARALYLRSNPGRPERGHGTQMVAQTVNQIELTPPSDQAAETMSIFSNCLVSDARFESDAFIRANPGSPAEATALGELKRFMPDCLTTSDKLSLNREPLRAGLSVALYKQYVAASGASAAAGAK